MRDRDSNPAGRSERSRATLTLAVLAAVEAAAIILLLVTRTSEVDGSSAARVAARETEREWPAFSAPEGDRGARPEALNSARPVMPLAGSSPESQPQPPSLGATRLESSAVGLVLCGTVAAVDGGELAHAKVRFARAGMNSDGAMGEAAVSHGLYAIAGLTSGSWSATCSADGCLPQVAAVELDPSRSLEQLDFLLERAACIPVRFRTPDGIELLEYLDQARIPGALRAIATLDAPPSELPDDPDDVAQWTVFSRHVTADGDVARWKAEDWDGVLKLEAPLPVYVSAAWGRKILASEPVAASGGGVTFTLPVETFLRELCSIRLRVIDADSRQVVEGALVQLDGDFTPADAGGVLLLDKLKPGSPTLRIRPPGAWTDLGGGSLITLGTAEAAYGEIDIALELHPGQQLDLGDVPLQRTFTVKGRVTDAAGQPVVASVSASRLDLVSPSELEARPLNAHTDEKDGSFLIRVVPGRWSFTAGSGSMAGAATVLDVRGDVDDLRLIGVGVPLSK